MKLEIAASVLICGLLMTGHVRAGAGQWHEIGSAQTWVGAPTTPADVSRGLTSDLSNVLRKYEPTGGTISDKKVEGHGTWSRMSFTASKELAPLIVKSVKIEGVANSPTASKNCKPGNVGAYYLEFNLGGSSPDVVNNAWAYALDICIYKQDGGPNFFINAKVWAKEGGDYSSTTGAATFKMLNSQAWPMIEAMSKMGQSYAATRGPVTAPLAASAEPRLAPRPAL